MRGFVWGLVVGLAVACSSGSGDGGSGGGGGSGGSDCNSTPCFAPAQCVKQCGDAPVEYGCCGCPSGWVDVNACPSDGGCAPQVADAGSVTCGSETCGPTQICVHPCCGGAPLQDGEACKPAPPFCAEASEVSCCAGPASCSHPSGCSGQLSGQELACLCA